MHGDMLHNTAIYGGVMQHKQASEHAKKYKITKSGKTKWQN